MDILERDPQATEDDRSEKGGKKKAPLFIPNITTCGNYKAERHGYKKKTQIFLQFFFNFYLCFLKKKLQLQVREIALISTILSRS